MFEEVNDDDGGIIGEDGHVETANPFPFTIVRGWMIQREIFGSLPKDARSTPVRGIR